MVYNLVTMNIETVRYYTKKYPIVGISMNPSIAVNHLKKTEKIFLKPLEIFVKKLEMKQNSIFKLSEKAFPTWS